MLAAAVWLLQKENSPFSIGFVVISCYYLFTALVGHVTKECGFGRIFWIVVLSLMAAFQTACLIALAAWPNETIDIVRRAGKKEGISPLDTDATYHSRAADFLKDQKPAALFLMAFGIVGTILAVSFICCLRPVMIVRDEKPPLYL